MYIQNQRAGVAKKDNLIPIGYEKDRKPLELIDPIPTYEKMSLATTVWESSTSMGPFK